MKDLVSLICGSRTAQQDNQVDSEIGLIMNHLSESLISIMGEINSLKHADDKKVMLLGPFLGRGWLEVALTAIVGRLDPFRLMMIRRMQLSSGYDRTMPWKSAIRWQGDVLSAAKAKELWSPTNEPKDVSRALFGDYYDELLWKPALGCLADSVPIDIRSRWLTELLANPVESFAPRKREAMNSLYSELSKSVHFESVTPSASLYDRISIVDLIQRCVRETAETALLVNLVGHSFARIGLVDSIRKFSSLEDEEMIA